MFSYEVIENVPERFAQLVLETVRAHKLVALSGGNTIKELIAPLGALEPFRARILQVDERLVPPQSPNSNYSTLVSHLGSLVKPMVKPSSELESDLLMISEANPTVELPEVTALADQYASKYESFFEQDAAGLVHLGLGHDGHTASLFPRSRALEETVRKVTTNFDPSKVNPFVRVTLSMPAINSFERRIVIALGQSKQEIVRQALFGSNLPIHELTPENTLFLLDPPAAGLL